jgi:N-methylhydantoinase B/oxoprolinase/acetone carboxylase alpha subunit
MVSFLAERTRAEAAAPGIRGGLSGAPGEVRIDDKTVDPKSRHVVNAGTRILLRTPGGGGYGVPRERSQALADHDRVGGYIR